MAACDSLRDRAVNKKVKKTSLYKFHLENFSVRKGMSEELRTNWNLHFPLL